MPKRKETQKKRAKKYSEKYKSEFILTDLSTLWCILCGVYINTSKKYNIEKHRITDKHKSKLLDIKNFPKQGAIITNTVKNIHKDITNLFISANIPLSKLRNRNVINFFEKYNIKLPSETTARRNVEDIATSKIQKIAEKIKDKQYFLIIDESQIHQQCYLNCLIGTIENPNISYLIEVLALNTHANSQIIQQFIFDIIQKFNLLRNNFYLLISDAASYMVSSTTNLKSLYPNMFHITCISHLIHNCCLKLRGNYKSIDRLISSIKAATVNNKDRYNSFKEIGLPPHPVLTRWGSWLRAALYYSKNFHSVKRIISSWDGPGGKVSSVKDSFARSLLEEDLIEITRCYSGLVKIITDLESKKYTLKDAYDILKEITFENDPCSLKNYIEKRLLKNDISNIVEDSDIEPDVRLKLFRCQSTSVDVERSFSIMNKVLCKEKNFRSENIKNYVISYYNGFMED